MSFIAIEELKDIQIGSELGQKKKTWVSLTEPVEVKLISMLIKNLDLFTGTTKDMPNIDRNLICHLLAIDPKAEDSWIPSLDRTGRCEESNSIRLVNSSTRSHPKM